MKYGTQVETAYRTETGEPRDGIAEVLRSHTGNAVLRIGRELELGGERWERIGHVVLTRAETRALIDDLAAIAHTRQPQDDQPDPDAEEEPREEARPTDDPRYQRGAH